MPAATSAPRARLGYLPALDGLRALAIVLVVLHHASGIEQGPLEFGVLGVDVFFVLSGFLITALIAEQMRAGSFSRRRFYARRAIRLMPALVVTVVVMTPAAVIVAGRWELVGAAAALLYLTPLLTGQFFFHTWTLAFEEWFYLLWPIVLAKFFRDRLTLMQCAALVGALGVVTQGLIYLVPGSFVARPSGLLIGCALALCWLDGRRFRRPGAMLALGLTMILVGAGVGPVLWDALPYTLAVVGAVLTIGAIASDAAGPVARGLASRPMVAVGVVSYEWYLVHFPLLQLTEELWGAIQSLWMGPLSLGIAFALHRALAPLQARLRSRLGESRAVTGLAGEAVA